MINVDAIFTHTIPATGEGIAVHCGVTWDYCTEEGQSACLVYVLHKGVDIISILDDAVREDLEAFAVAHNYEIDQRATNNSMRDEQ